MDTGINSSIRREFPSTPLVGVGAIVVDDARVLLVRRGTEPLKGRWTLPGGMLEVGEVLTSGVIREVREETGLDVEPVELVELLDRIHREEGRVRYHYVIADYLCRVTGGELRAASDAEAVRWVERCEWSSHSALVLDPITVRVIEKGWQRAEQIRLGQIGAEQLRNERS
jgi:8-oxo-dGTP diphosphatase